MKIIAFLALLALMIYGLAVVLDLSPLAHRPAPAAEGVAGGGAGGGGASSW